MAAEEKKLVLKRRNVWVAGLRYRVIGNLLLDVGAYNEAADGSLADVQIYTMLNVGLDVSNLRRQAEDFGNDS